MRILYIDDDPVEARLEKALKDAGLEAQIVLALTQADAREFLPRIREFDIVLMDYHMGSRGNTIETGLVSAFVEAGAGRDKSMLVANSSDSSNNSRLLEAGCSHENNTHDFSDLIWILEETRKPS